ncbi:hypothetical protein CORT_0D06980 [Candida orthopsilosis Co 90-125]|uniref:RRM domain-containing protein n=1 Tax=Candida orthopsilosis (strain 90-125) TaxID=1136231 RepID=H8X5S3_CANO9|nr:hypothetical protein CORT_0D06980 [Candida orthopsilosis Co 90-125]CCG23531.1 hypothetical protein CORT_0D06980 [Candida orthopsilosis Co 90-125]
MIRTKKTSSVDNQYITTQFLDKMSLSYNFPIVSAKNVSFAASPTQIFETFAPFGHIYQIRHNPQEKGQYFVIYHDLQSAQLAAKELNGVNLEGRYLVTSIYGVDKTKTQ